jgi:hypothetical protein
MRSQITAFVSGAIFGVGLLVSGMTRPAKVVGFLDLFGAWDASLAFVMGGAIGVHFIARRMIMKREAPLMAPRFDTSFPTAVDAKLLIGAALFGVGWGLGGYCPGPAVVSMASGTTPILVFVGSMLLGMLLQHATTPAKTASHATPSAS